MRGAEQTGDQGRVRQAGDADGDIEAAAHRVDLLVAEHQLQFHVRMLLVKQWDQRPQPPQAEGHGRVDPQHAAQFADAVAGPLFGFIQGRQQLASRLVVFRAGFGQVQAAGGALQQLHANGLFQRLDLLADFRARHIHGPGRRGKAIGADGGDEGAHAVDTIHIVSFPESMLCRF